MCRMHDGDRKNLATCWLKILMGRGHFGDRRAWEANATVVFTETCVGVVWIEGSIGLTFVNTVINVRDL
jgi:hypothetical protein